MTRKFTMALLMAGLIASASLSVPAQEADLLAVVKSDASLEQKVEAFRQLQRIGTVEAVPVMAACLTDKELAHWARYVLEPMPFPEVDSVLRDALGKTDGVLKVGVISSIGERADKAAAPQLIALLPDSDAQVVQAASIALGKIGTPEAAEALQAALAKPNLPIRTVRALCDGLVRCAESRLAAGQAGAAIAVYDQLLDVPGAPGQIREAALRGAILARGNEHGQTLLIEAVRAEGADFDVALRAARELPDSDAVTAALAAELAGLAPARRIELINLLGHRGGSAGGAALLAQAKEGDVAVRIAALGALTRIGFEPALPLVEELCWTEGGDLAKAARDALSYFPGSDAKTRLARMLKNPEPQARRVAVELIGQGGLDEPVPVLMAAARSDKDAAVRVAALKALGVFAGMDEAPGLLDALQKAGSPDEIKAIEGALEGVIAREKRSTAADVVIRKAVYGALPNGPSADVTAKVVEMVKNGAMAIDATNANFGDPANGIVKRLRIEYTANGAAQSKTVKENQTLILTTAMVPAALVDALCAAEDKAQGEAKLALLRLLGKTTSPRAFAALLEAAQSQGNVKETALRTVCEWPTADALPTVMKLVENPPSGTMKVLALRGAVRLLKQSDLAPADLLQRYTLLMDKAKTADEKKLVLSGVAQVKNAQAFEMVLAQLPDPAVKAEAVQAAVAISNEMAKAAHEDKSVFNGKDLTGWECNTDFWSLKDGAIVGGSEEPIPYNMFAWSKVEVSDFYLVVDVKLEPPTGNGGIQFRSKKINDKGQARGYQADMGKNVWNRLYHEQGRGKLFWDDRGEAGVRPGEWNRYEILAVGPAIWTAVNGKLGVSYLDLGGERSGLFSFQIHGGHVMTASYRVEKLVHNPKIEMAGMTAEQLLAELRQE